MTRLFFGAAYCLVFALVIAARQQPPTGASVAESSLAAPRDSALEARTSGVASRLRCPVCQGLSIQDSPSELARSMRSLVRAQLAEGRSPAEVEAYFVSKYGEWILLAPSARGFNLLAYAAPIVLILGGAVLVAIAVRRWTANGAH